MMVFDRDDVTFTVVVNHEEQYSIWPTYKAIPNGWTEVGVTGSKKECLDHIEQVWTDMRPLSLRKFMDEGGSRSADS
jgi:MbtH protein